MAILQPIILIGAIDSPVVCQRARRAGSGRGRRRASQGVRHGSGAREVAGGRVRGAPKAIAQPTMMMARLAVLATECVTPEIFLSARVETSLYR